MIFLQEKTIINFDSYYGMDYENLQTVAIFFTELINHINEEVNLSSNLWTLCHVDCALQPSGYSVNYGAHIAANMYCIAHESLTTFTNDDSQQICSKDI